MDRRNRRRRRQWTLVVYPVITGFVRLRFIGRHTPSARRPPRRRRGRRLSPPPPHPNRYFSPAGHILYPMR
jgi:hypothetical protein